MDDSNYFSDVNDIYDKVTDQWKIGLDSSNPNKSTKFLAAFPLSALKKHCLMIPYSETLKYSLVIKDQSEWADSFC